MYGDTGSIGVDRKSLPIDYCQGNPADPRSFSLLGPTGAAPTAPVAAVCLTRRTLPILIVTSLAPHVPSRAPNLPPPRLAESLVLSSSETRKPRRTSCPPRPNLKRHINPLRRPKSKLQSIASHPSSEIF